MNPIFSKTDKKFNVIILAGGRGTRLKPATEYLAKPLIKLGEERAIDHLIKKYEHIAHKIIIGIGYEADLLENYIRGKYNKLNIEFSREDPEELHGPGHSLMFALDHVNSRYPTLITFCDYIVEDVFDVDNDAICVCDKGTESVLGTYRTIVEAEEGIAQTLKDNFDEEIEYGFTGIAIFHNTLLLKAITYDYGASTLCLYAEYEQIIKDYMQNIKTSVIVLNKIYDFGDPKTLEKTRRKLDGHSE